MIGPAGIRARLTLFYAALLTALFLGLAVLLHLCFQESLYRQLDTRLRAGASGTLHFVEEELDEPGSGAARPLSPRDPIGAAEPVGEAHLVNPDLYLQLLDTHGRTMALSSSLGSQRLWSGGGGGAPGKISSRRVPGLGRVREIVLLSGRRRPGWILVAALSEAGVERPVRTLDQQLAVAFPVLLLIVAPLGYLFAGGALRPVSRITQTARVIRGGDLTRRIALKGPPDELKELADEFDAMIESLGAQVSAQRQFLADASHELRTPLTVISSALDVTLRGPEPQPARARDAMQTALGEARRMQRLVEDLMTLARADAGQQALRRERVLLDELVVDCCDAAQWLLGERRLTLVLPEEACLPVTVAGDPDRLRQLLQNLLQNAVQHTAPDGAIRVLLRVSDGRARLSVRDNGAGIAPADLPRIFDRFYRADTARRRGGSGLGLAICRWIADAHGGCLTARSDAGQGSEFSLELLALDCRSLDCPAKECSPDHEE